MPDKPNFFPEIWGRNRQKIIQHNQTSICPIWSDVQANNCWTFECRQYHYYWSAKAGGAFGLSDTLNVTLMEYLKTERDRIVFSRWVFDKNYHGEIPKITTTNISYILKEEDVSIEEKLTRVLLLHEILAERPSRGVLYSWPRVGINAIENTANDNAFDVKHLCFSGANSATELDYNWLLDAVIDQGLLTKHNYDFLEHTRLTPKGLEKINEKRKETSSQQAFVAMWFNNEMDNAYENAIEPAVKATGHSTYRVDKDNSHSDQITNKIIAEIKNSKFLIADFTHGTDGARGGVYFEAGFALGYGIPVLWTIRKDKISKMHFDTNHYPHIVWETEIELKEKLEAAILAHKHIGKGPL